MASSSSSSNKRLRRSIPSSNTSNSQSRQATYVRDFKKTDGTDLLLESSDGFHFAVQKVHLSVASTVFKDTLLVGSDEWSDRIDSLPVLKVDEKAKPLHSFLAFVQLSPVIHPFPIHSAARLDILLRLRDKYDAPYTGRTIFNHIFPRLLDYIRDAVEEEESGLQDLLALSLIAHSRFETGGYYVGRAIRMMGCKGVSNNEIGIPIREHSLEGVKLATTRTGLRPFNIFDISATYYNRMSKEHLQEFTLMRELVLTEVGYSWRDAADDFAF